jgi:hypothetical protein
MEGEGEEEGEMREEEKNSCEGRLTLFGRSSHRRPESIQTALAPDLPTLFIFLRILLLKTLTA